ncbi:MAG TPA: nucleotidyl transferase AbiEii/AbiGii toxin family protein [Rhizomicrobium sp.]
MSASEAERRVLFDATAQRLGTAARNVEKDFWVTWTLDALFNGLGPERPRLLFKGGTSLSKGFGLISRFSEDIDITVFRADLGQPASVEELEALTGRKRRARLDAIKQACQAYIATDLHSGLSGLLQQTMTESGLAKDDARVVMDTNDVDQQSLLLWYPSVTADSVGGYVQPAVKIESGAKSALDPHHSLTMTPYIAGDVADIDLVVPNVTTVDPERTFWDIRAMRTARAMIAASRRQRAGVSDHG